jgi:hypothetical protein
MLEIVFHVRTKFTFCSAGMHKYGAQCHLSDQILYDYYSQYNYCNFSYVQKCVSFNMSGTQITG